MNELQTTRTLETVTAEINTIREHARRVVLESGIEIGRRLVEAKELMPHGEWGKWLAEKVEFSQDAAERLMKLYHGYADKQTSLFGAQMESATLRNLSISNALLLLKVPEDEREAFAEENDVEHMSTRELERLIRERDELQGELDAAGKLLAEKADKMDGMRADLDSANAKIRELEARPVEVAVEKPDPAEIKKQVDAAVREAEKAAKEREKALRDKLREAEKQRNDLEVAAENSRKQAEAAEKRAVEQQAGLAALEKERLEGEVERLKKQIAMSDAAVAGFGVLFQQAKEIIEKMLAKIGEIEDAETAGRLRNAVLGLLDAAGKKVAGDG